MKDKKKLKEDQLFTSHDELARCPAER